MYYKLHITNWIQQNLGDVSAWLFFFLSNPTIQSKQKLSFFNSEQQMKNIQYNMRKQCNFVQLKYTHTYQENYKHIYTQTHRKMLYDDIHTNNLPKHKTKLSHMQKSMGTSTQRKSICSISAITACSNVTTKIIEIPSGY